MKRWEIRSLVFLTRSGNCFVLLPMTERGCNDWEKRNQRQTASLCYMFQILLTTLMTLFSCRLHTLNISLIFIDHVNLLHVFLAFTSLFDFCLSHENTNPPHLDLPTFAQYQHHNQQQHLTSAWSIHLRSRFCSLLSWLTGHEASKCSSGTRHLTASNTPRNHSLPCLLPILLRWAQQKVGVLSC